MFGKLTFVPAAGGKAVEHSVSQRLTYVGRDKDCAIRLEDPSVDGKQFLISCTDQQARIQNLSGKLPTQVNRKSIGLREDKELSDRDTISFGNKQFLWTMSSSRRREPPRHDCLKRTRVSEPVRKVAVVTPNRREMQFEEDYLPMPPEKRRRTMFDPSAAATPEASSFSRRVKYDKQLKQTLTPNRRKQSMGKAPASLAPSSSKKKSISCAQPLGSPQLHLTYDHETAFNKSITPGRFYRRSDGPFPFRGFNTVPAQPISPGLLSGCDSFLSMEDSQMSRRSSARVSTPYPNKSMRGSSQSNKTPHGRGTSGMYFPSIQEEMTHRSQHDATPSSYFSSTSGSPRMMRAESPTVLPGGSGSPFQGRRSLVQSSRSSSYGTPQQQSLHSHNDSLYVNASGSSQMRLQDFEGSSVNKSHYSWTSEGLSSPRSDSFAKTPLHMRTPRRSRGPIESPGSAAFSPNPSGASTSGYVLLSPRGRNIINGAFNRNDMSLQLSPQHSPSRRLFNFSARTDNRRIVEPAQPLSVQVLTKSLKKKLNFIDVRVNSPRNPVNTPGPSGRGRTPKNSEAIVGTPAMTEPVLNGTPKSTRSIGLKRATPRQSNEPDLPRASRRSGSSTPRTTSPVGASKGKSPVKADNGSSSTTGTSTRTLSRLSGNAIDLRQSVLSTPVEAPESEPKKIEARASKKKSVKDEPVSPENATPRQSRLSRRSLGPSTQQSSEPDLSTVSQKSSSIALGASSPVGASSRRSSAKAEDEGPLRNVTSTRALSRLSGRPTDLRQSALSTPDVSKSEPRKSTKKRSVKDEPVSPENATPRQSRLSKRSLGPSPRKSSEPAVSRTSRKSGNFEQIASSPVDASNSLVKGDEKGTPQPKSPKRSLGATPRHSSEPNLSRFSRKSSDLRMSILSSPVEVPYSEPRRSKKGTPNSESTTKRTSVKNELGDSSSEKAMTRESRLSKLSVGATPRQLSEPDLSGSSRKSSDLRKSVLQSTPVSASKDEPKRSLISHSTPNQNSSRNEAGRVSSRASRPRKSSDLTSNVSLSSPSTSIDTPSPMKPWKRSNTSTYDSQDKRVAEKEETPETSYPSRIHASVRVDLSPDEWTPSNTSVKVNLRSSRKLSTKKDSPSTPLTSSKVASQLLSHKRKMAKSLSEDSIFNTSPKSYVRNSLPVSLERSGRKSGALVQEVAQAKKSGSRSASESPLGSKVATPFSNRRSRASLVFDAANLLHLSASRGSSKKMLSPTKIFIPEINVISPTPPGRLASASASGERAPGGRSSRRSGAPRSVVSLPRGIRKSSVGKRSSLDLDSKTPDASGPKSPERSKLPSSPKSKRSSRQSSAVELSSTPEMPSTKAPRVVSLPHGIRKTSVGKRSSVSSETEASGSVGHKSPKKSEPSSSINSKRASRRSAGEPAVAPETESVQVTPPRSVEPEVVMRSSRKNPRLLAPGTGVPSTPTSVLRRNARRSSKRSPVPSIRKKLSLASPRKDSTVKKLTLDPEKPDKKKIAALIACHKKKSPTKENRPSASCSDEKTSPGKSVPENLTPLKDLDAQPEERSPEDALLDALDLSRKSAIVAEPKRPSRRLRSSNRRISAQGSAQSSSKSTPASSSRSVKKLLFKTPLVEYEGSNPRAERSPSRSLKGILMPSPTTASEEPMSRVFTTSPVVDFTDASGKKKIFRASPNSKSKVGGIRELVPAEESDLNIWTLFEDSSSGSESARRKRRGCEPTEAVSPKKTKTSQDVKSASPPQSIRRKRAAEEDVAVLSSKRSRKMAGESVKKASAVKSARKATTAKAASSKSTRRNLQEQFEHSFESPKPSTTRDSPKPTARKVASPKVSPKQLRKAGAMAKAAPKAQATKKAPTQSMARGAEARKTTPVKSPAKTRRGAAAKSQKKSVPKPSPRAGKTGATKPLPKTTASKAKPKKAAPLAKAKAQSKINGSILRKSSSPAKSPLKSRRGAVAKTPKKVVPAKSQSKTSKSSKSSTPAASPAKTRRGAVAKSPKKAVQAAKGQSKAAGRKAVASSPAKSPPKTRKPAVVKSLKRVVQTVPPIAGKGKSAKSPPKASTRKVKGPPKASTTKVKSPPKASTRKVKSPPKASTSKVKSPPKASTRKLKSPPKASTRKVKSPPKAVPSRAKPTKPTAPSPARKVSPKKTRGKLANPKAEAPKPAQLAKPKANRGARPKTAQGAKPRLSVPPKPLKGKAVGGKVTKKPVSPKKSPVKTRSLKTAAASTAQSSRGKR